MYHFQGQDVLKTIKFALILHGKCVKKDITSLRIDIYFEERNTFSSTQVYTSTMQCYCHIQERWKTDSDFRPGFLPGIWDAIWWSTTTSTTVG